MTSDETQALLDAAKVGIPVCDADITHALHATGDLIGCDAAIHSLAAPKCDQIAKPASGANMNLMGRPATMRTAIQAALEACTDPLGATGAHLAEATGLADRAVHQTLTRMRKQGLFFQLGEGRDVRYFGRVEKRDAAQPAYEMHMQAVRAERAARAVASDKSCQKRYRAKLRALKAGLPVPPKPPKAPKAAKPVSLKAPTTISLILQAVAECSDPLGMLMLDLPAKVSSGEKTIRQSVHRLIKQKRLYTHGSRHLRRLFLTLDQREAAAPTLEALQRERQREMLRVQWRRQQETRLAAAPPKKQKEKKAPAFQRPRHKQAALVVSQPKVVKANFKDAPAIIPPNVKVTQCPGFVARTFAPPESFVGEFRREWQELRQSSRETA